MSSKLNPYISFAGDAQPAMEFYKSVFGGDLSLHRYAEMGGEHTEDADKIMHAALHTDRGYTIMASDVPPGMDHTPGDNIAVSVSGDDAQELRGYWERLSEDGTITVPLERQMWGDVFGVCVDRFGITWMVSIAGP